MTRYVRRALDQGLHGWRVTDCIVTMHECDYYIGDGPRKRVLPTTRTTAADFRKLTPLVLRQALRQAGTVVCEPVTRVRLELPAARMGATLSVLTRLGAAVRTPVQRRPGGMILRNPAQRDEESVLEARLPSVGGL